MMKTNTFAKICFGIAFALVISLAALTACVPASLTANAASYAYDVNPPRIICSPSYTDGYASSVEVTILWENTSSYKFYSVKGRTGIESGEIRYAEPFVIRRPR